MIEYTLTIRDEMGQSKKKIKPKRKKGAPLLRVNKEFVRKRREELGMSTDTQLAERCGMTRQNLWRTLNYEGASLVKADLGSFIYLAEALECKIDDLVISSPTDNTARRKKSASRVAGVASCIAAVAASWFVSATWYTLDRSVVDWALVFTSSSTLWFVVFGVLSRQWFLLTNVGTLATSGLFLLPGRPDIGAAHWMMGALLVGTVCYSALWTRLNWLYNGGVVHWQPAFAFTRLSQLRSLLPQHFGVMATSVILGGLAASILEWAAR